MSYCSLPAAVSSAYAKTAAPVSRSTIRVGQLLNSYERTFARKRYNIVANHRARIKKCYINLAGNKRNKNGET